MTETQRAPEGMSSKPRIKPANAQDDRPVSISARLGRLQFHHSGKFRVLQLADIQDGPKVSKDTIRLIEASLDATRPDLVIFTGNQIAGYDTAFEGSFRKRRWSEEPVRASAVERTRELVRKAIGQFTAPMAERGIPWAVTYGNHDFQCGLDNSALDALYREFPGCVNPSREGKRTSSVGSPLPEQTVYTCATPEPGTFALPVHNEDGTRNVLGLALIDSGDYAHGGGFGTPSAGALDLLRRLPRLIGAKTMVFQHMPLPEYYQVLKPVEAKTAFAMQGYRAHAETYYVLDDAKTQPGGYLGEGISCPDQSEEFAILRDARIGGDRQVDGDSSVGENLGGDRHINCDSDAEKVEAKVPDGIEAKGSAYIGVVAGHDHRNGFVGEYEGLLLIATPTCGFNTYGPAPAKRAARLIEFDIRHPYEPRTQLLEFGELVGKPSSKKAYTYAVNQATPGEGEGDDLLRKPSLWSRIKALLRGR
nr:metallophosphoesterase [Bifidobacterium sp. DSM 109957]